MNIAVADEGGNIVSHVRMDGAWIGSIDISQKKAYTSRAFDIATKDLASHSQSGGQFFGIHASNNGKIMIFAGGIPLKKRWKGGGRHWRQRRIGRSGPRRGRSGRSRILILTKKSERRYLMASNRGVVYLGPGKVEVQSIDYPKLQKPAGKTNVRRQGCDPRRHPEDRYHQYLRQRSAHGARPDHRAAGSGAGP